MDLVIGVSSNIICRKNFICVSLSFLCSLACCLDVLYSIHPKHLLIQIAVAYVSSNMPVLCKIG